MGYIDLFKETHFKEQTGWVDKNSEEAYVSVLILLYSFKFYLDTNVCLIFV